MLAIPAITCHLNDLKSRGTNSRSILHKTTIPKGCVANGMPKAKELWKTGERWLVPGVVGDLRAGVRCRKSGKHFPFLDIFS